MEITVHGVTEVRVYTSRVKDTTWTTIEITSKQGRVDEITLFGEGNDSPDMKIGKHHE